MSDLNTILSASSQLVDMQAGIEGLRSAVVSAAVTGQLVKHSSKGTAQDLLDQIADEKRRLGLKQESLRDLAPASATPPHPLPAHWALPQLAEVLHHCRNGAYVQSTDEDTGGLPVLRISAATSRRDELVDLSDCKYTSIDPKSATAAIVRPGDLLACRYNGNLHYVGRVAEVPKEVPRATLHPDKLICLRAPQLSHSYLRIALNSKIVRRQIESVAVTTAGNIGINGKQLKAVRFPLPPVDEQERIAALASRLFALLDQLEEARLQKDRVRTELVRVAFVELAAGHSSFPLSDLGGLLKSRQDVQKIEKAVLQLAVSGRLTQDSVAEESGKDLALKLGAKLLPAREDLPESWASVRLDSIAEVRLGRQRSPGRAYGDRMRPYLRAANVTWNGLNLSDVKEMDFTEAESELFELRSGDVLLSEASGSPTEVGKPAQFRGEITGCCFQNTLIRVRLYPGLKPDFYELLLRMYALTGQFVDASRGLGIQHLGAKNLASVLVPVPPVNQQVEIVAKYRQFVPLMERLMDATES